MLEFDKWLARVLLLNGVLGIGVALGMLGAPNDGHSPVLWAMAVLACGSAWLCLRARRTGLFGGMLYYILQVPSFFPDDGSAGFSIKAGISIGSVVRLDSGVLVINWVAAALLVFTMFVLVRRP
ncbi:MAG: hypothetical protein V4463_10635 [Pseudomonadota bacterium]